MTKLARILKAVALSAPLLTGAGLGVAQAAAPSPKVKDIAVADLDTEVRKHHPEPVLLDVTADWCGPCHMLKPELDSLAERTRGALKIVRVNFDSVRAAGGLNHGGTLPLMILYDRGRPIGRLSGFKRQAEIRDWAEKTLGRSLTPVAADTALDTATAPVIPAP